MNVAENIEKNKIIAILRGFSPEENIEIITALYEGGVRLAEITLNTPDALKSIKAACSLKMKGLEIGAGTVLTPDQAESAIQAGATYIISPGTDVATIKKSKELGAMSIPGALTPSEVITAYQSGADFVKIFPSILGPDYIKDLLGPLDQVKLVPTGGVNTENIISYLEAGAVAFGMAGELLKSNGDNRFHDITRNAQTYMDLVKSHEANQI